MNIAPLLPFVKQAEANPKLASISRQILNRQSPTDYSEGNPDESTVHDKNKVEPEISAMTSGVFPELALNKHELNSRFGKAEDVPKADPRAEAQKKLQAQNHFTLQQALIQKYRGM